MSEGSDSNVVELHNITRLDIPAERVLDAAPRDLDGAVVIGWEADGSLYFASSIASGPEVLWLLELAKRELMTVCDE